jgi:hypothetical protein
VDVNFDTGGSKQIFVQSELRINHDTAKRIVIGEPEFYSCITNWTVTSSRNPIHTQGRSF